MTLTGLGAPWDYKEPFWYVLWLVTYNHVAIMSSEGMWSCYFTLSPICGGVPLPRSRWGEYPIQLMGGGGTPSSWWGILIQLMGGTPSQVLVGVPLPRSRQRNYPNQLTGGYPGQLMEGYPIQPKGGYPIQLMGGTPPGKGVPPSRGTPLPEQHSVCLRRGGRYVSCVHAGGLSCFYINLHAWVSR